jgi:hypothetical protein
VRLALNVVGVLAVYKGEIMNVHLERFLVGFGVVSVLALFIYLFNWIENNIHGKGWKRYLAKGISFLCIIVIVATIMYFFGGLLLSGENIG